jgi:lipopolysaccharide export system protein LptA
MMLSRKGEVLCNEARIRQLVNVMPGSKIIVQKTRGLLPVNKTEANKILII